MKRLFPALPMELLTFGLNHQTAPLHVRERVVFSAENLVPALHDLTEHQCNNNRSQSKCR